MTPEERKLYTPHEEAKPSLSREADVLSMMFDFILGGIGNPQMKEEDENHETQF